jgi:hypothetical protein
MRLDGFNVCAVEQTFKKAIDAKKNAKESD